jgi:hypothetical protein
MVCAASPLLHAVLCCAVLCWYAVQCVVLRAVLVCAVLCYVLQVQRLRRPNLSICLNWFCSTLPSVVLNLFFCVLNCSGLVHAVLVPASRGGEGAVHTSLQLFMLSHAHLLWRLRKLCQIMLHCCAACCAVLHAVLI